MCSPARMLAASLALLAACAGHLPTRGCRSGEQPAVMDSLYFGTATPDGRVSADDWQRFLAVVVTPRFPEGSTSWAAAGQWRDPEGRLEQESSWVLHIVHPDTASADADIVDIVGAYKAQFHQRAVLRVRSPACVSF